MITFDEGHFRFNYRVVDIALDSERVLIHKGDNDNFWSLPGGRCEFQESARDTLVREMQEEIGADICPVCENGIGQLGRRGRVPGNRLVHAIVPDGG